MKNLSKDDILSLYVDKVSELKKFIRLGYMSEDTDIFKDITELEMLETVMGYRNIDACDKDEAIDDSSI